MILSDLSIEDGKFTQLGRDRSDNVLENWMFLDDIHRSETKVLITADPRAQRGTNEWFKYDYFFFKVESCEWEDLFDQLFDLLIKPINNHNVTEVVYLFIHDRTLRSQVHDFIEKRKVEKYITDDDLTVYDEGDI